MVNLIAGLMGQRLLSSPPNATSLLKSFGYRAVEVEGEAGSAVALFHSKGLAHLDISCYNFLCNSRRRVALIDFDMSLRTHPNLQTSSERKQQSSRSHLVYPRRTTETPPEFRTSDAHTRLHCAYKLDVFALGVLILRFAKASGFDCPQLVLLAEPLI
ncbi:hypothetical protein FRC07_014252, partial [Ceratobasidium sp. 392]